MSELRDDQPDIIECAAGKLQGVVEQLVRIQGEVRGHYIAGRISKESLATVSAYVRSAEQMARCAAMNVELRARLVRDEQGVRARLSKKDREEAQEASTRA